MRDLHLAGLSADGSHLTLRDAAGTNYRLEADDELRALVRDLPPRPVATTLSPREIQARLRAGVPVAEVAAAAGLSEARLAGYAAPVLSERAMVLEAALGAVMSRPHLGPSTLPLGRAVEARLGSGDGDDRRWTARRSEDGSWVIELSYSSRGRARTARWRWDRGARALVAADATAQEIGHVPAGDAPAPRVAGEQPESAGTAAATSPPEPDRPTAGPTDAGVVEEVVVVATTRARRSGRRAVPAWADVLVAGGPVAAGAPAEETPPAPPAAGRPAADGSLPGPAVGRS